MFRRAPLTRGEKEARFLPTLSNTKENCYEAVAREAHKLGDRHHRNYDHTTKKCHCRDFCDPSRHTHTSCCGGLDRG